MIKLKHVEEICKKHNIILAYLFGSEAQAGYRVLNGENILPRDQLADLDLGIIFRGFGSLPGPLYNLYASIYNDFDELFSPLNLDLVFLQETHSVFQFEAIKGICIYAASELIKDEYEHIILARAADFRWVLEQYYRERLEEILSRTSRPGTSNQ